jgi:hypothetical protein
MAGSRQATQTYFAHETVGFNHPMPHVDQDLCVCSAATAQLWKASKDGNLKGVQTVVNNTPQDQRAALLNQGDPKDYVSLLQLSPAPTVECWLLEYTNC